MDNETGAPPLPRGRREGRRWPIVTADPSSPFSSAGPRAFLDEVESPTIGVSVLLHVEIDCSVEASILQGIWTLHLNDFMRSRFRWIPHEPIRRLPKPRAVRANKNAAGEGLDVMPKGSRRTLVALHGDRLILDAMPIGI
ncbi:hypothetical protein HPB47_020847 [Ixodes persulcatus]|uniref:Uncharacterized protein n=1 Tax=Ixodes persulcatus TaxID=34615 RepID=A0AC60QGF9_IXOPE|nr:hypothetical protein HPB47_020847 [Ixodes persulcatus]